MRGQNRGLGLTLGAALHRTLTLGISTSATFTSSIITIDAQGNK